MIEGILPNTNERDEQAHCLMMFEWANPINSSIQKFVENSFSKLNSIPNIGTGHNKNFNSHGSYNRVKKRLYGFLDDKDETKKFDIRIRDKNSEGTNNFFPCTVEFVANNSDTHPKQAQISVSETVLGNPAGLVDLFMQDLLKEFGVFCGGCFSFPSQYGPAQYLSSIGAIPQGEAWGKNKSYTERITRWRNNVWRKALYPSSGYFREIYPINFILPSHLHMPFRDKALSSYMESNGQLTEVTNSRNMFRWDLTPNELGKAQRDLEGSGLVLSSATKPIN